MALVQKAGVLSEAGERDGRVGQGGPWGPKGLVPVSQQTGVPFLGAGLFSVKGVALDS